MNFIQMYNHGEIFIFVIKMEKTLKDPKIIGAVVAGFLVPKITSYLGKLLVKAMSNHKAKHRTYVGIELGGTNYNIAFGEP